MLVLTHLTAIWGDWIEKCGNGRAKKKNKEIETEPNWSNYEAYFFEFSTISPGIPVESIIHLFLFFLLSVFVYIFSCLITKGFFPRQLCAM
jgi:hypothetical protein